jgi:hypothetical protein
MTKEAWWILSTVEDGSELLARDALLALLTISTVEA